MMAYLVSSYIKKLILTGKICSVAEEYIYLLPVVVQQTFISLTKSGAALDSS